MVQSVDPKDLENMNADSFGQMTPDAMGGMDADMIAAIPPDAMGGNERRYDDCHAS